MDIGEFVELLQCDDDRPIVVEVDGKIRHINHVIIGSMQAKIPAAIIILTEDDE